VCFAPQLTHIFTLLIKDGGLYTVCIVFVPVSEDVVSAVF
jgi:hypothetical protein